MLDRLKINFNGIVGGAAARWRFVRNETRKADSPGIDAVFSEIIITKKFTGNFGDTLNCRGTLGCILWSFIPRRIRTKGCNRARRKDPAFTLPCYF